MSGAFRQTGIPRSFKKRPELAVPFVAEISTAIREKKLVQQTARLALLQEQATEPAYERAGGSAYAESRRLMEAAQDRYIETYRVCRTMGTESDDVELAGLREEMKRHQAEFVTTCRAHEPKVAKIRTAIARNYWSTRLNRGIPDVFFADVAAHSAAARMQRIHPPWWGLFLGRLQQTLAHGHPAAGYLLDVLPQLRAEAKIKTFAAMVTEWRETHADRWGWYGRSQPWMLARRSARKAVQVTAWINAVAPGYLTSETVRYRLHDALQECLMEADPSAIAAPVSADCWIHGRN